MRSRQVPKVLWEECLPAACCWKVDPCCQAPLQGCLLLQLLQNLPHRQAALLRHLQQHSYPAQAEHPRPGNVDHRCVSA